jgi:dTDP-glucose 4,6-dehydratase
MKSFDYLILGSSSFSGSNFVDYLLSKNKKVIGVGRSSKINNLFLAYNKNKNIKNFKYFKIDINKDELKFLKLIKKHKFKYVVNFIAQGMVAESWVHPLDWYNTNVLSQIKIIEMIRKNLKLKKYIHFTTPEVYGSIKNWFKETNVFNPSTPYAVSRSCTDSHLLAINKNFKFPCILTRASNVYGKYQQLYRIVPRSILFPLLNKKITIDGIGDTKRSFIHIKDVCDALYLILNKGKIGETYHISTNKIISIKNLVFKIIKKIKLNPIKFIEFSKEREGKDKFYVLSSEKIRKLGWTEKVNLNDGLDETILWVLKNFTILKKQHLYYRHKK